MKNGHLKVIAATRATFEECKSMLLIIWFAVIFSFIGVFVSCCKDGFSLFKLCWLFFFVLIMASVRFAVRFCRNLFLEDNAATINCESKRLKKKYNSMLGATDLKVIKFDMPEIGERMVRYPVSHVAKRLLFPLLKLSDRMRVCDLRRVNPRAELRLKHLLRSRGTKVISEEAKRKFRMGVDTIFNGVNFFEESFIEDYTSKLEEGVRGVIFDGSAAAGYPFAPGTKKRDVVEKAYSLADYELNNGCPCLCDGFDMDLHDAYDGYDTYRGKHVWYTGGRGKLKSSSDGDSGRIIQFSGFAIFLLSATFIRPVMDRYNSSKLSKSAIGMSWFYGGCHKFFSSVFAFLRSLGDCLYWFFTLDVAGWDSDYNVFFFEVLRDRLFLRIHDRAKPNFKDPDLWLQWRVVIIKIFDDIMKRHVWVVHVLVLIVGCMPSGFAGTADFNTFTHEAIYVGENFDWYDDTFIRFYGDDVYGATVATYSSKIRDDVYAMYKQYGFTLKLFKNSFDFREVDFLSVYPQMSDNSHFDVSKDYIETLAKFCYPDDAYVDDSPEAICSRLLGYLCIVWKDKRLGRLLYDTLINLCEEHDISVISCKSDDPKKIHWTLKFLDWKDIHIDEVPSFLDSLHKEVVVERKVDYDEINDRDYTFDLNLELRDEDANEGRAIDDISAGLCDARASMPDNFDTKIKRLIAPFKAVPEFLGHAGAKIGELINRFSKHFGGRLDTSCFSDRILVIGSHPGSDTRCLKRVFQDNAFHIISAIANWDRSRFLSKARDFLTADDVVVESDYDSSLLCGKYRFASIDVAYGREHGELSDYSKFRLRSATKHFELVSGIVNDVLKVCPFVIAKINGFCDNMFPDMYDWYKNSCKFELTKVSASYPWNLEFHVVVIGYGAQRPNCVSYANFKRSIFSLWNSSSDTRLCWQTFRQTAMYDKKVAINPLQSDDEHVNRFRDKVVPKFSVNGNIQNKIDACDSTTNWPELDFDFNHYRSIRDGQKFFAFLLDHEREVRQICLHKGVLPIFTTLANLEKICARDGKKLCILERYDYGLIQCTAVGGLELERHPFKVDNLDMVTRPIVSRRRAKQIFDIVGRVNRFISLYSGCGIDSLFLICNNVVLVDNDKDCLRFARYNFKHFSRQKNIKYVCSDVEKFTYKRGDVFLADPPFSLFCPGKTFCFGRIGFITFPASLSAELPSFVPSYTVTICEPGFAFLVSK
jgi:hypothetical protein